MTARLHLILFLSLLGMVAVPVAAQENTNIIVAAEYFIDADPGQGLATPLPPKDGSYDSLDESTEFEVTTPPTLPLGVHHLYVRMKGAQGIWSTPIKQMFIVEGPRSILAAEYFIDDPGRPAGAGTPLTMASGMGTDKLLEALEIPTTGLSVGIHTVYVRAKDQDNIWGPARAYNFQVLPPPVVAATEYYIGPTNNPAGTWQAMSAQLGFDFLTPEVLVEGLIDTKTMARGTYRVWVRGKDQDGRVTTAPASAEFQVAKEFPLLNIVPDQLARAGSAITIRPSIQNSITGTFLPFGVPSGVTVNSTTGEIQWTIPANEPPGEKTVNVQFDDNSTPSLKLMFTFTIVVDSATQTQGPALLSAKAFRASGHADLVFSKPLEPSTAQNPDNYRINGVRPVSALLRADGRTVTLSSPSVSEEDFQVTVLQVQDTLGRAVVAAGTPTNANIVPMLSRNLNGNTPPAGEAFARGDSATDLTGVGVGFTGDFDSANFVYEELIGDFDISVQLKSFTVSDYFSSAGLVARASLAPGSLSVAALWRPLGFDPLGFAPVQGFTNVVYARTNSGAARPIVAGGTGAATTWLRLQRSGGFIRVLGSNDGQNYSAMTNIADVFPDKLFVGLATASGLASGAPAYAQFRSYTYNWPAITENPVSQRVPLGGSAVFGVKARSTAPLTYQWFRDNIPMAGQNQSTLRIPTVFVADAGQYFVRLNSITSSRTATLEIGGLASGIKGDVAPRANGDGLVGVSDWVQTARFVVKLDTASSGEVYRADTAPRASGGDGILTVMDMVQTARYVVGLDARPADRKARSEFIPTRTLQISSVTVGQAGVVELPVVLKAAGGENAVGFSLSYKPKLARLKSVRLGDAFAQGTLYINNNADTGKAGVVLGLPVNASLPPGDARICWLNFEVLSTAEPIDIQFADDPVRRELIDAEVNPLPTIYEPGAITISENPQPLQITRVGSSSIELTFPANPGQHYRLDFSTDLMNWSTVSQWESTKIYERLELPLPSGASSVFYRVNPVP